MSDQETDVEMGRFPPIMHCAVLIEFGNWPLTAVKFCGLGYDVKIPIPYLGFSLRQLILILFCGIGTRGIVELAAIVEDPTGVILGDRTVEHQVEPDRELLAVINIGGMTLDQPGTYKLTVLINQEPHFETPIEVYVAGEKEFGDSADFA